MYPGGKSLPGTRASTCSTAPPRCLSPLRARSTLQRRPAGPPAVSPKAHDNASCPPRTPSTSCMPPTPTSSRIPRPSPVQRSQRAPVTADSSHTLLVNALKWTFVVSLVSLCPDYIDQNHNLQAQRPPPAPAFAFVFLFRVQSTKSIQSMEPMQSCSVRLRGSGDITKWCPPCFRLCLCFCLPPAPLSTVPTFARPCGTSRLLPACGGCRDSACPLIRCARHRGHDADLSPFRL